MDSHERQLVGADAPAPGSIPLQPYKPNGDPLALSRNFHEIMQQRRSVRYFSNKPVPREVIENIVRAGGTAPSGANKQPWRFVAVSDPALKREIRIAAEEEEKLFYEKRASEVWKRDLYPLGTDWRKPFLEIAPWLIVVFKLMKDPRGILPLPEGEAGLSDQVYYVNESVGIAVGFLLAAAHHAGLCALTHTPSPMKFLAKILKRPDYERPYLLIPLGYPAEDCIVPDIHRKNLAEILVYDR
jgi:nitroreductase